MNFKLGKNPYQHDPRHIQYRALLPETLPEPPAEYDVDMDNENIWPLPLPMFANDKWGCCVIAGRANKTMRDEKIEQGDLIQPSDQEVLSEYWREQGDPTGAKKPDEGLYVNESLNSWRTEGWKVGGNKYDIYAYAQVNKTHQKEIMSCISLLNGAISGVTLYDGDIKAVDNKEIWTTDYPKGEIAGGHCMYVVGYTRTGVVFMTWGQRQVATWDWVLNRLDEFWGVVQNKNAFLGDKSPINTAALDAYLKAVTS